MEKKKAESANNIEKMREIITGTMKERSNTTGPWDEEKRKTLLRYIARGNWAEVKQMYKRYPESHEVKIDKHSGDTTIHVAVSDQQQSLVKEMVAVVGSDVLAIRNDQGNTPLHLAASLGSTDICQCIAEKDSNLTSLRNQNGETPLFLAVANGSMDVFRYLHGYCKEEEEEEDEDGYAYFWRSNGDTNLHVAITGQHFDIAYCIIHQYTKLVHMVNKQGESPLHLLAAMPSSFESGNPFIGLSKLIYRCITVGQLEQILSDTIKVRNQNPKIDREEDKDAASEQDHWENSQQDEEAAINEQVESSDSHQPDEAVAGGEGSGLEDKIWTAIGWLLIPIVLIFFTVYWVIKDMLSFLMALFKLVRFISGYKHYMETTLLIAAKHGIVEMVERILDVRPDAIFDVSTEQKNIVMLAAENRHPHLYEFLLKKPTIVRTIFEKVDNHGNSVLHITAKLEDHQRPWRIRGAALQMHMEVKWYNYVKDSIAYTFISPYNNDKKAPEKIFEESHKELKKEGRQWLIDNSQSCSVVAALIATVAFATSATFPGGFKQDSGIPALENDPVFIISAVASLTALCSSMISVVMFLGILTSNFQQTDFLNDLPFKHLVAMVSLLVSILSMLVSFLAGHQFVLKQKLKHAALPVYIALCVPLLYFIIKNFPLDYPTMRTTLKKKPQQCGS